MRGENGRPGAAREGEDELERTDATSRDEPTGLVRRTDAPLVREMPRAMQPHQAPAAAMTPAMTSDKTDDLFRELALAQLEFGEVVKTRTATIRRDFSYKYANLNDVCVAVMPALRAHSIVPIQIPRLNRVVVRLVHGPSGQWIEGALPLVLPDHGADVQRLGSAITYVRRYLLCMMLGIVAADEDDDGATAAQRPSMGTRGNGGGHARGDASEEP